MGFRRGVRITFSYNECRIAPRGPSLAAAPGLATVGAGVIARSPRRGSGGCTSRRATFAQPMILKEPNTVNLRPSAPTSNTVNIVLMLTSVLGYILLCSMKTAHYGDRGGGLGVNPLRLTPTLNTTEQTVILDPIDSTCSTKRYDDQCRGQISHAREYIPPWLIPLWPSEPCQVASSSYVTSTGGRALNRPDICE